MPARKRPTALIEGTREARAIASTLGSEVARGRRSRVMRQEDVARRVGISRSRLSEIERGFGDSLPLATWISIGIVLGRPLRVELSRPHGPGERPADAGYLEIQELILRLARSSSTGAIFELPTKPLDPRHSADVGLRDETRRVLTLVEAWNTIGDLGAAIRSTDRKQADGRELAIMLGGDFPYRVASVWVVRATSANRALVGRYPETFDRGFQARRALGSAHSLKAPSLRRSGAWCGATCREVA
jgi:transcriptional regulator with XRE-family HTH domain